MQQKKSISKIFPNQEEKKKRRILSKARDKNNFESDKI